MIINIFYFYAIVEYLISAMVAQYYFAKDKTLKKNSYFKNAFKFSIKSQGTLIFSSCIVAIVVWVRFIFEYIYKRLEQNGVTKTNTVKWIACIIRCALKML